MSAEQPTPEAAADEAASLPPLLPALLALGAGIAGAGVGLFLGAAPAAIALGALVLVVAILLFWSSVRLLLGENLAGVELTDEAAEQAAQLQERTASDPLFERKRAALAALADMERERELGKIDAEDYEEVVGPLRAQAKQVLKEIDDRVAPYRAEAERIAADYLTREGVGWGQTASSSSTKKKASAETAATTPANHPDTKSADTADAAETPANKTCASCKVSNDADAKFCKACGTVFQESADAP